MANVNRVPSGISMGSPASAPLARSTNVRRRPRAPGPVGPVPRPRTRRPPEIWSTVAAAMTVVGRGRATIVTTPVPRRSTSVCLANAANVEKASRPVLSGRNRAL